MNVRDKMHAFLAAFVFVNLIALARVVAEGPPRRLTSESARSINFAHTNETVTLKCPVESPSSDLSTFIDWTKGNESLYMAQGYEITLKGFLKIKSVANHHSGIYTCEAVNGYGSTRVNLTLVVVNAELEHKAFTMAHRNSASRLHFAPPSITRRSSSFSADVGGEVQFHCISGGRPMPQIFWLKEGLLIQGSNSYFSKTKTHSTLKLKRLTKSDAGDYKCIAKNSEGEDEMDFKLQVADSSTPPKIISVEPPIVTVREGGTAVFVCQIVYRPGVQLHVKWLKRQEGLDESEEEDLSLFRSGKLLYRTLNLSDNEFIIKDGVYKSKLFLRDCSEADAGTYICLALNDRGYQFKNSTLKVIRRASASASANQSNFSTSGAPLVATIAVSVIIVLVVIALVSHRCSRNKSEEMAQPKRAPIPTVETGSIKHSVTSIRKPNARDVLPYSEANDPPATSKLISIDSTFLYDHSESQISKSAHTRASFH